MRGGGPEASIGVRPGPNRVDLRCAFTIFGFLDTAEPELVELRKGLFEEVAHPHHYTERRAIVDAVPVDFLRRPHKQILEEAADWRSVLDLPTH